MLTRRQALGSALILMTPLAACERKAAEIRTADRVELDVPHLRQETLLCVPTCAAMVLAYYGDDRAPRELKTLAAGQTYDPAAPFTDFSITLYRDLIQGLSTLGYHWAEESYAETPEGLDVGIRTLTASLVEGRPVLVDVSIPEGHTFVIRGFDAARRLLHIVDPNRPAPGRYSVGYDEFATVWNERAYGQAIRALLATRPKTA